MFRLSPLVDRSSHHGGLCCILRCLPLFSVWLTAEPITASRAGRDDLGLGELDISKNISGLGEEEQDQEQTFELPNRSLTTDRSIDLCACGPQS